MTGDSLQSNLFKVTCWRFVTGSLLVMTPRCCFGSEVSTLR